MPQLTESEPIAADETGPETPMSSLPPAIDNDKLAKRFQTKIEVSKRHRRKISAQWKRNIAMRMGDPRAIGSEYYEPTVSEDRRSLVSPDWALTKTKTANLYSQVPAVQCTHENAQYATAIPPFAKALNYELGEKRANVGPAMEEMLNDVVNAAGVGAILVGYMERTQPKLVPVEEVFQSPDGPIPTKTLTPEQQQALASVGLLHLNTIDQVVDRRIFTMRISPSCLLWPSEFTGSNFDDADWRGYKGRLPWSVAKYEFHLTDDQKDAATGGAEHAPEDDLRTDVEMGSNAEDEEVTFDDLYYWRYRFDPDELSFSAIWRIVFVHGIEKAVLHEPWKGQQYDEQTGKYVGSCKPPLRFLTVTYISDHAVPPSDSEAGRPQVYDMRRSRSQMFDSRDRNRPLNWFDVNRVGQAIQGTLQKGTWMGFIPTNGDGSRALGQIARASFPAENHEFDRQNKADLMETWQIGPNQQGTTGAGITATESDNVQANFATRIGQERARVASCFLGIAEIVAGWMCLHGDFPTLTQGERQAMEQAWDRKHILHDLVLKIRPDSQITVDVEQRIRRLTGTLNLLGKSGLIEAGPIAAEILELTGLDPTPIMKKPEEPKPDPPNVSYRFSGKDDMVNPAVVALLFKLGMAPSEKDMEAAKKFLEAAAASPLPQPPGGLDTGGPLPAGGPEGPVPPQGVQPSGDWGLMPKVAKRTEDISGGRV